MANIGISRSDVIEEARSEGDIPEDAQFMGFYKNTSETAPFYEFFKYEDAGVLFNYSPLTDLWIRTPEEVVWDSESEVWELESSGITLVPIKSKSSVVEQADHPKKKHTKIGPITVEIEVDTEALTQHIMDYVNTLPIEQFIRVK